MVTTPQTNRAAVHAMPMSTFLKTYGKAYGNMIVYMTKATFKGYFEFYTRGVQIAYNGAQMSLRSVRELGNENNRAMTIVQLAAGSMAVLAGGYLFYNIVT